MNWLKSFKCGNWLFLLLLWSCADSGEKLFKLMPSSVTGINFVNGIYNLDSLSVLEFEFIYNGAGVAVGDFNNDQLPDLYFTGNMSSNRLYLNRGDWKFEDVTEAAGLLTTGWSNGVSLVDINQDGNLDIYVSRGGPRGTKTEDRANLLFINNGDLTFTESASSYGLDNTEYTVQSAFLDYDLDGDLDVYLLSNALVNFNRNTSRPIDATGKAPSVDKLFRNDGNNSFTEVSESAGILIEGFGLGVEVCDINEDHWPDIYVSNDFLTDDLLYINQKDGSFKNEAYRYLKHQTYNGMGNDLADFNNDGWVDIVVLDMLPEDNRRRKLTMMGNNYDEYQTNIEYGYQPQYIRNTLQLNNGNGTFSEIGQLSGIDATDWSWSVLFADYDNDGYKDLFITNGYRKDVTNLDFVVYGQQVLAMGEAEANRALRLKALDDLPGAKLPNYVFKNKRDLTFENTTEAWGLTEPTYSNGAVYADLDNDGDLDLVINNIDQEASVYQNSSRQLYDTTANYLKLRLLGPAGNIQGLGTKVTLYHQTEVQYQFYTTYRGYLSSIDPNLHFGLGSASTVDSIEVIWPGGASQKLHNIQANQTVDVAYQPEDSVINLPGPYQGQPLFQDITKEIGLNHRHRENLFVDFKLQPTLPHMHSRNGPGLAVADIDNNGLQDIYVGGAAGQSGAIFIQQPDGSLTKNVMAADSISEDMGALLFDANGDGFIDLYLASGGSAQPEGDEVYQDRLFRGDGNGNFIYSPEALPLLTESSSCVIAADYDQDGDLDLFVGGRVKPGAYPLAPKSYLLRNESEAAGDPIRFVIDKNFSETHGSLGMVTGALWTDFNNDHWMDLIVVGEFMPIKFFVNRKGILTDVSSETGLEHTYGWWNSITGGDFDADGDIDYLVGNLGLNSRLKASPSQPLCIYAKDFDKNGRIDPVMCYYVQGENYIAHTRDDIIAQISAMRARFRTYEEYAEASFEDSFLASEIADAYVVRSETFETSYLENLGEGKFARRPMPIQAQFAPVYGMSVADYNLDGFLDAILTGNFYSSVVSTGKYDASIGLLLLGNGHGDFEPVPAPVSGILADGDTKGMVQLLGANGKTRLMVANNSGPLQVFEANSPGEAYVAKPSDQYAMITTQSGNSYKHEFYHGSAYLSSPGRFLLLTPEIKSMVVYDGEAQSRTVR